MSRLPLLALALVASACTPSAEPPPPAPDDALHTACVRALARLAPEHAAAAEPPLPLSSALEPTLRALSGTGMGDRVAALDLAVERAARLALREAAPRLESEAASFARPADTDSVAEAFRSAREPELRAALAPTVPPAIAEAQVGDALDAVREGSLRLPLRRGVDVDLVPIVTDRALERFFAMLADEERPVREGEPQHAGYGDPSGPLPGSEDKGRSR